MSLELYLSQHFVDKAAFAALAGIPMDRLDQLIEAHAIPRPTYTCDGVSIRSAVFGDTPIDEALTGEYFRPECVRWVRIADRASPGDARSAVVAALTGEFRAALQHHGERSETIEGKIQAWLPYFFDGTFGLCVADPATGAGIARKELLQEKLVALTANGSVPFPAGLSKQALLELIDAYAEAAMPFSPAEYARSSRKRLVEDLRAQLSR